MAKRRKDLTTGMSNQMSFLTMLENDSFEPGEFDIDSKLKTWASKAICKSEMSRWEIAGKLSEMVNYDVSKSMLDAWTAESKESHRFPASIVPALCIVTGDYNGMRIMARTCRCSLLETKDAMFVEIAKMEKQKDQLHRNIEQMKNKIQAMS